MAVRWSTLLRSYRLPQGPPGELGFYSVLECTGWISKPECGPGVDVPRI